MCGRSGLWKRRNEQRESSARHRLLTAPPGIAILGNSACGWIKKLRRSRRGPSVSGPYSLFRAPRSALLQLSSIMLILWVRSRNEISTARGTQIYSREAKS